jgi:hypothetical protein
MNLGQIRRIEWDQRIAGEPARAEFVIEGIIAKLVVFDKIPDGMYAKPSTPRRAKASRRGWRCERQDTPI